MIAILHLIFMIILLGLTKCSTNKTKKEKKKEADPSK